MAVTAYILSLLVELQVTGKQQIRVLQQLHHTMSRILHAFAVVILLFPLSLSAGGGPETTLLVVNADSPLSLTVANRYVQLRQIPESHVVWLHGIPSLHSMEIQEFREQIWTPIKQFMDERNLADHIDAIVYSADFPYAVKLHGDLTRNKIPANNFIGGYASLTGMTFFARQVENRQMDYLSLYPNGYYRRDLSRTFVAPADRMSATEKSQLRKARYDLGQKKYQPAYDIFLTLSEKHQQLPMLALGLAEAQAELHQYDQAISNLKRLEGLGFRNSLLLRNDRHLKDLHNHPGFQQVVQSMDTPSSRFELPQGFHSRYHWARRAIALSYNSADRYYLSSMLAYTGQLGNSLEEIEHYLQRSAFSDGSRPDGTVYLMENGDIRAETRQPWFDETCALLKQIGHRCEILAPGKGSRFGILPTGRRDIIGLVTGARSFDWDKAGSSLLPGAIADSFTSWGGDFNNPIQTKLTEFLRQGASGSSGAVTEPYSFAEKFPLPLIHYYYASGCSLAESWYQSVASPYQMILVADPLTQPFAQFAGLELISPSLQTAWSGAVQLDTKISPREESRIARLELWIDGIPVSSISPGDPMQWDSKTVDDGYHDLRIVAEEDGLIRTRTAIRHGITVYNHDARLSIQAENSAPYFGQPIVLSGKAENVTGVEIYQGGRKLGETRTDNGEWRVDIPTDPLGMGEIHLTAVGSSSMGRHIRSNPVTVRIGAAPPLPPINEQPPSYPGLVASIKYANEPVKQVKVEQLAGKFTAWTRDKPAIESVRIDGEFLVESTGFYQITISTKGTIKIAIDENVYEAAAPEQSYGLVYIPVSLGKGWHRISIQPGTGGIERLSLLLSGQQAPTVLGDDMVHNRILTE